MTKLFMCICSVVVCLVALVLTCNAVPFISYAALLPVYWVCVMVSVVGILTILTAIIGIFGIQHDDLKSVICYAIVLLLLAIPKIFSGLYIAVSQDSWDDTLGRAFNETMEEVQLRANIHVIKDDTYKADLAGIQSMHHCCGWNSPYDYAEDEPLPPSCCPNEPSRCSEEDAFVHGCRYAMNKNVTTAGVVLIILCFVSAMLDIFTGLYVLLKGRNDLSNQGFVFNPES